MLNQLGNKYNNFTPFQKIGLIAQISSQIKNDIDEFWRGVNVARDKLVLDGENLILIYEYILAKCSVRDLYAHIQLCFEFSTPFLKTTKLGYCLTTIQMAMAMLTDNELIEMEEEDEKDEEAFYRRSREFSQSFSAAYNRQEKETLTFQLNVPEKILQNKLESTSKQARH